MRHRIAPLRRSLAAAVVVLSAALLTPVQPAGAAPVDGRSAETLLATASTWSYHDSGTDPGPTWNQPDHDDADWSTGNGQFGYGDGDETTVVDYGPDADNKHATTHFRTMIEVVDAHELTDATATLTYDDGAIVYVNGTMVHHSGNIAADHSHRTWANQSRDETVTFPVDPGLLTNGPNTIAVEIHQVWRKSSDISFDLALDATRVVAQGPLAPTAADDRFETAPGRLVSGSVAGNDRANDANPVTWTVATDDHPGPAVGALQLEADGAFTFDPAAGFEGSIVVPYQACNGNACAGASLTLAVEAGALITRSLGLDGPVHLLDPGSVDLTVGHPVDLALDFQVTNGTFSYLWLPSGLQGTSDGRITGTPDGTGATTARIHLVDLDGNGAELRVFIAVRGDAPQGGPAEQPTIDPLTIQERPVTGQHGVIGVNPNDTTEADVRVWDMQQIGEHLYLGGEFQQVQTGEGGQVVDQAFLARFDVATGHYDPTFTPDLDGNVHAIEATQDGLLIIGGEFTSVDGVSSTAAVAAIDPTTGTVDEGFRTSLERPWSSNEPLVRELEVVGDSVYVAGNFSHIRDRSTGKRERMYKLTRLAAGDGAADLTWRPRVAGGSIYGIGVDQDRGRVMVAGSFSSVDAVAGTSRLAIVDTVIGDVVTDTLPATAWKVFDVEYANDMIFVANGWNNQVTVHDADTFGLLHNYESDGDFQFLEKIGDHIYIGCHCTQDPERPTARVLSAVTGEQLDIRFDIGGNIDGAWTMATDTTGCLWIGGDIVDGGFSGTRVWARGLARFCPGEDPGPDAVQHPIPL